MSEDAKIQFRLLVLELLEVPNEHREHEILNKLDSLSPDPEYLDYIFHSNKFQRNGSLDVDGLVKKVFAYEAIRLPRQT